MSTVKKNISNYTEKITDINIWNDILTLFKRYNAAKTYVCSRYSSVNSYEKIFHHKTDIRDVWTKNGMLDTFNLPKRYSRMAIDDAIASLKSRWVTALKKVNKLISKNESLSKDEKHYLRYALKSRSMLSNILRYKSVKIPDKLSKYELDTHKLNNLLRRLVRKSFPKKSIFRNEASMEIDQEMYSFFEWDKFELSGFVLFKRWKFKTLSPTILTGNIKIILDKPNKRLRMSQIIYIKAKKNKNEETIGIDKNYNNVFDTNTEKSYGVGFNELQNNYTNVLSEKDRRRNFYYRKVTHLEAKDKKNKTNDNQNKIANIKKFNLGKKKYNNVKNREFEEIRKHVNSSIKTMIIEEKPKEIVEENLNFSISKKEQKAPRSKKSNNKLNMFVKGYVRKRLEYITNINDIILTKVNAAYTSQIHLPCGHFGERDGDAFYCPICDKGGYSGYVAAENVLARKDDPDITLKMSPKQVKSVIEKRLSDRAGKNIIPSPNRANLDLKDFTEKSPKLKFDRSELSKNVFHFAVRENVSKDVLTKESKIE